MENWLDKYKPSNVSEILGNKQQIQRVIQYVKQFTKKNINTDKITNPNLIITGQNGIGKTLLVDSIIEHFQMEKITPDLSDISITKKSKRKKKVEKEFNGSIRTINTYYVTLQNFKEITDIGELKRKKIVVVFDDVSNITNLKEKEAIKALIKINNKLKQIPIIIIANTRHNKIVIELRKMISYVVKSSCSGSKKASRKIVNEISIKPPLYEEMEKFIKEICRKEKLKLVTLPSDDSNIFLEIINHSQYDVRRLINILEELKMIYMDEEITLDKFYQYCETSKTKDMDPGIYEATRMLLNNYSNINNALLLYGEERATIPLMVHENYPSNISYQYPRMKVDNQLELLYVISRSISESDKVDGLIYSNQCWSLQPVHGFYSCVIPSYHINQQAGKMSKVEKFKYTQDYNKTSIKKINNKVIKKAQEHSHFKKFSIHEFLYISYILKTLLEQKKFETIAELMKPYNLKLKEIESIIKIDKIKKSKSILTGKERLQLKEMLGVTE